ncbi:hypothetical protein RchiOBHm_Chr0c12g0499611 [Rosa chinensis]|uniref:Uncharacterized protein n=1 Tax=Rosa chinensis TaxID=74649 RepID=A0A2P6SQS5_ROSCH|nr:hypothetical protein RchiOBHm_Chr0c12g0499611 [Rosa chinensis]
MLAEIHEENQNNFKEIRQLNIREGGILENYDWLEHITRLTWHSMIGWTTSQAYLANYHWLKLCGKF